MTFCDLLFLKKQLYIFDIFYLLYTTHIHICVLSRSLAHRFNAFATVANALVASDASSSTDGDSSSANGRATLSSRTEREERVKD